MKVLRKGLNILVMCVAIVAVAIISLLVFVDPNRLKPLITAEVSKQTGYQLEIDGQFSWSFYPRIGIKAEGMQITAPQQKKPFIEMRDVMLGMDFFQLLQGKSHLSGDIHVAKLTLMNMQAQNVSADVAWEDNVLTISPISALLYEGWLSATVYGRELTKTPNWSWELQLSRIQLKPFLRDLSGQESKIQIDGMGQLRMDAGSVGTNKDDFIKQLNGNLNFNLSDGSVSGIDLNYWINRAVELIKKEPVSNQTDTGQTAFEHLNGTMKIKQGVATTADTTLVASAFTVKVSGSIDLAHQVIDYGLNVVPQQLDQFKWGIPIDIEGGLHNPSVKLDMLKLNTIIANEQFQHLREKAEDKLKKLPAHVDNFLQKVFGGEQ